VSGFRGAVRPLTSGGCQRGRARLELLAELGDHADHWVVLNEQLCRFDELAG
jgi:hypothetical protein